MIIELNKTLSKDEQINTNITFDLSVNTSNDMFNEINLDFVLPDALKGLNIGYKIYKLMVKEFDYITSRYGLSPFAKNIWYKFLVDADYFCFTSKTHSGVIYKQISNDKIFKILETIKKINSEIIFDNRLKEKITELYGNIENYKK